MLRALDDAANHQAVGKVRIAVRAEAIGCEEPPVFIAIDGIGFSGVVEANHIGAPQIGRRAHRHPSRGIGLHFRRKAGFACARLGLGQPALHVKRRILHLAQNRGKNLAPCGKDGRIGRRAVAFHDLVQPGERVIRHQREHVVLYVVIHVPVDVPADWIHINRAAIEPMVQNIFRQPRVLRSVMDDHEPRAKQLRQHEQENRNPTMPNDRCGDGHCVNCQIEPRVAIDLGEFGFGNESSLSIGDPSQRVPEQTREMIAIDTHGKKAQKQCADIRRLGNLNFGITSHNDGVAVVAIVAPAPKHRFAHHHERSDFVNRNVHPVRPERSSVAAFMPT